MRDERLMPAAIPFHQVEQGDRRAARALPNGLVLEAIEKAFVQLHVGPRIEQHAVAG